MELYIKYTLKNDYFKLNKYGFITWFKKLNETAIIILLYYLLFQILL